MMRMKVRAAMIEDAVAFARVLAVQYFKNPENTVQSWKQCVVYKLK